MDYRYQSSPGQPQWFLDPSTLHIEDHPGHVPRLAKRSAKFNFTFISVLIWVSKASRAAECFDVVASLEVLQKIFEGAILIPAFDASIG